MVRMQVTNLIDNCTPVAWRRSCQYAKEPLSACIENHVNVQTAGLQGCKVCLELRRIRTPGAWIPRQCTLQSTLQSRWLRNQLTIQLMLL